MGSKLSAETKKARRLLATDTESTYKEIARKAGVSRDTLYKDPVCAAIIKQRREQSTKGASNVHLAEENAAKTALIASEADLELYISCRKELIQDCWQEIHEAQKHLNKLREYREALESEKQAA